MKLIGKHEEVAGQLVRYALTGGLASVVNIGVYWVLAANGMRSEPRLDDRLRRGGPGRLCRPQPLELSRPWRRDNLARTGGRFFAVSLVSFALNQLWVWLLVEHLGLPLWGPYPPILGVTPLIIFALNRRWVFA